MSDHVTHDQHSHAHGSSCEHTAVKHEGHVDYLHDGHVDEHALAEGGSNLSPCSMRRSRYQPSAQAFRCGLTIIISM
ncbi:MAG TPA: hypothetical protein VMI10_16950 [Terriglobales bacterium]|nr:hypothetical protein [Terriglobales bacterium]